MGANYASQCYTISSSISSNGSCTYAGNSTVITRVFVSIALESIQLTRVPTSAYYKLN